MRRRRSRLAVQQTERLLEHFVAGTPARTAAELVGVNRNTATRFYHCLREVIGEHLESLSPLGPEGSWQRFQSSSGDTQTRGAAAGKACEDVVLAWLTRGGKVYTALIPHAERDVVLPRLDQSTNPGAYIHVETLDVCELLDIRSRRRTRRRRREGPLAPAHIGGIANFQSQVRRNLRRYNGVPSHHLLLFLKECEWRFNYGSPRRLLETLARWLAENRSS
jgi:transposase